MKQHERDFVFVRVMCGSFFETKLSSKQVTANGYRSVVEGRQDYLRSIRFNGPAPTARLWLVGGSNFPTFDVWQ